MPPSSLPCRRSLRLGVAFTATSLVLGSGVALADGTAAPTAGLYETLTLPVAPEPDGSPVRLDVRVYPGSSSSGAALPAVLVGHGFGGSVESVDAQAREIAAKGYVAVTWTARGFAARPDGGRIHLNAPDLEVADVARIIDHVASLPSVKRDAPGDPRVAVVGASYGGAVSLMAAGKDRRIDAVVAAITWNDLDHAFFPQSASAVATGDQSTAPDQADVPGPFKQVWASNFFFSGLRSAAPGSGSEAAAAPAAQQCGTFDPVICTGFLDASVSGKPTNEFRSLLRSHSPAALLKDVTAPTLLIQGMADSLFGLDQADATAKALRANGTPVAVRWTDGGHDAQATEPQADTDAMANWLAQYLADGASRVDQPRGYGFEYVMPPARRNQSATTWGVSTYPGLTTHALDAASRAAAKAPQGVGLVNVPLAQRPQSLMRPPGGQPAAMVAIPGASALGVNLPSDVLAALPGQSVRIDSDPLTEPVRVVGSPTLQLTLTSTTPEVTLFASLWLVSGETATLARPLVAPMTVRTVPGRKTQVKLSLPAGTYQVNNGQSVRVVLSATEASYANARTPMGVQVQPSGMLQLPTVDGTRISGETGVIDTEAKVALGLLAALLLLSLGGWQRRRMSRRAERPRPDLASIPLAIEGLVKEYADGHRAVDGVTWRAEPGQVVGLLGPNGAGKTTTMRMVMGLIRPDQGTVHILGEPVHAGSPVLGRVGALIEGPGFLPHLTGRANLHAYWAATGRPAQDAHVEEALDVAALGDAIDRPVRSYSHGMKQRLGIAQAMLGLPDLLILDEPTNGLDPPQIAAMRPILQRYAATGRTVVVSSHLLAEVEMTCSHVVVMHAGRVITQGAVADLVDSADTTLIDLDVAVPASGASPGPALAEFRNTRGIKQVRAETSSRLVVEADVPRAEVVAAAVEAGLPVVGVSSRRHLEEVFLGVISDAGSGSPPPDGGETTTNQTMIERLRQVRAR